MIITNDALRDWGRRVRSSDRTAFTALFRALYADLHRYARSFASDAADDLVQDAFVRLWDHRGTIDEERSLRAYLFVTLRHIALNSNRQVQTRRRIQASMIPAGDAPRADAAVDAETIQARLTDWIGALPDRRREAFELSRFAGLSLHEIAAVMEISPKTAENHITQALKDLRARLNEYDPDLLRP